MPVILISQQVGFIVPFFLFQILIDDFKMVLSDWMQKYLKVLSQIWREGIFWEIDLLFLHFLQHHLKIQQVECFLEVDMEVMLSLEDWSQLDDLSANLSHCNVLLVNPFLVFLDEDEGMSKLRDRHVVFDLLDLGRLYWLEIEPHFLNHRVSNALNQLE